MTAPFKHPQIVDVRGNPLKAQGAYKAGRMTRELAAWRPARQSADSDLLGQLPTIQARATDLSRNYALTSGAHQLILDNVIGTGLTLAPMPNFHVLGMSEEWAKEWRRDVKQKFLNWAYDDDNVIDASRRNTLAGLFGLAFRSFLIHGEILASAEWITQKNVSYKTAIQVIDPLRLENSNMAMDTESLRAGVYLGKYGQPIAYNIRMGGEMELTSQTWKKIWKETAFGRRQIFHHFEAQRPGQSRGVTGLASVLAKSKMLEKFQDHALESAIVNSMYAAYIKSSMPHLDVAGALGVTPSSPEQQLAGILSAKADYYANADFIKLDGVKIPHLYPDEEIVFTSANHPSPAFDQFERAMIRQLAAGIGISYEQLARDYRDTNYSGARAGLLEAWKFFTSRRLLIAAPFGNWVYSLWLEEAIDSGEIDIPKRRGETPIEAYWRQKAAITDCEWTGNAKGHIDPLKETRADIEEVKFGLSTLQEKCANRGLDWEDVIRQRAEEMEFAIQVGKAKGLPDFMIEKLITGDVATGIMTDGQTQ